MKSIKETYMINENTLALLPAMQIEYDTIVIEKQKELYIRQTPFQLIKAACFNDWCTYEGKRQAVILHTNLKRKVPIPINTTKGIYFFPTHSQKSIHNNWIAFHHIVNFNKVKAESNSPSKTIISFTNGMEMKFDIPFSTIQRQIERAFECKYKLEALKGYQVHTTQN